jgi:hypothetical protein
MVIFIVNLRAARAIVTIEYISCDDLVTAVSEHAANLARSGLQSRATFGQRGARLTRFPKSDYS